MLGTLTRCAVVGTVFLLGGAGLARAYDPDELLFDDELLECADYIATSDPSGKPMSGEKIGEEQVTQTTERSGTVSGGGSIGVVSGDASGTYVIKTTVVYYVGYYRMADNTTLRIDCRTYSVAK